MVNKPPKPVKAPKANKRSKAGGPSNAELPFQKNYFSEESLFGRSQKFVQENDARPFRDFGYFIAFILSIFIWRYQAALADGRESKFFCFCFVHSPPFGDVDGTTKHGHMIILTMLSKYKKRKLTISRLSLLSEQLPTSLLK